MANPRVAPCFCLVIGMALSGLTLAADVERPSRFLPNLDGQLVTSSNPLDGSTWAAWTYRNGAETDIAVSRREPGGLWSEPRLVGVNDLRNQRQPALTIDEYGTTYLAYATDTDRRTSRVFMTALGLDAPQWTPPSAVTPASLRAHSPALMIAANRKLVLGYIVDRRVALREFSLLPPVILGNGNDGPDPVGETGWPPEGGDDTDNESNGLIDGEPEQQELEFTSPMRRVRKG